MPEIRIAGDSRLARPHALRRRVPRLWRVRRRTVDFDQLGKVDLRTKSGFDGGEIWLVTIAG